ncbi:alpha/beta hydrolase [Marinobacter nanhaiticus D15-8W]|uniref:Alpha/beta hydrolase n=1 Tax=Marinobacter nanhaiticus D15-8W TaxID=626887 RepID=N6WY71_9GAMM|nr:alpha/beta family hydrolase [Marinobacter nanhaiticus]ENO13708.1 alpha/beta hydrolase [Marinobacter nanhaiticus D15-8W]BES71080.1 alpha/beta hydrolase [Marinobacter nanhaiticus D15-8W]
MPGELINGNGEHVLLLAHGAGAPMDSPFMAMLAESLAKHDVKVVRFEFEYMQRRREDGKRRLPPKADKLLDEFRQKIEQYIDAEHLFIGGKSMGGRMASLVAASDSSIEGCVCFGYPFHPPGKPDRWRTDHFTDFSVPVMIQQGTRDPFGKQSEVLAHFDGKFPVALNWLEDGEHDFKPRKASGLDQHNLIEQAARSTADWMKSVAVG